MTPANIKAFAETVAADVAAQYPRVDYLRIIVQSSIERHAKLLTESNSNPTANVSLTTMEPVKP